MASRWAIKRIAPYSPLLAKMNLIEMSSKNATQTRGLVGVEAHLKDSETPTTEPRDLKQIPGPKALPFIGSMHKMLMHKEFDMKKSQKIFEVFSKEYGPIVLIKGSFITPDLVIITDPKDIEIFLRSTTEKPVRFHFAILKKIREETPNNYFNKKGGLLPENHEEWWRVRSRVQTPMMKPKNIHQYLPVMDQVTLEFVDIVAELQRSLGEMPDNFLDQLYKWALESVASVALNQRLGCLDPNLAEDSDQMKLIRAANDIMESTMNNEINQMWRYFPTSSYKKMRKAHQLFLDIADKAIRKLDEEIARKKDSDESQMSLMETLLLTPGLTRTDVVTLILDMLFAGIDTTSHTVAFLLYCLAKNPKAQKKLQNELDQVIVDGMEGLQAKHMARFSYLKCCLKESLRIYPTVFGISRLIQEDIVLSGYRIPKNTEVLSANFVACKDEKVFPLASEFIPERWQRDENLGEINPFASMPFSHGTRMCIGRRIAEQEIYTLIARLLHRFTVDYKYGEIEYATRLVGIPSKPLKFSFTERRPN